MLPQARSTPARCTRRCAKSVQATVPSAGWRSSRRCRASMKTRAKRRRVRRKFWIALVLTLPVVAIAMLPHLLDLGLSPATAYLRGAELLLSAPVVLWAALGYYRRGWQGVVNRSPNMYTLIGLGVIVAFVYSIVATWCPQVFPVEMRDEHGMVGVYFEVASAIVALVLLGEWLELRREVAPARRSASSSALRPRVRDESTKTVRKRMFRSVRCVQANACACAR